MLFSTILSATLAVMVGQASAGPVPESSSPIAARQFGDISGFITGAGRDLFGNAGAPCTVGNEEGECNKFGQCFQETPPNEQNNLNSGRVVDDCTVGGAIGVQQ